MKISWWYVVLICGIFCISTSAILITLADVPPTMSAFYRNLFAAAIWLLLFPVTKPFAIGNSFKPLEQSGATRTRLLEGLSKSELTGIKLLLILGFLFAADLWAWHRCIAYLGAGPATLMGNLQVLFVAVLAVLIFGERLKKYYFQGSLLALLGIGLLTLSKGFGQSIIFGIVFGFTTAITYALFLIVLKLLESYDITAEQILFWVSLFAALFLAPITYIEQKTFLIPTLNPFIWLLSHAFISSVIGWWLIIKAMHYIPVAASSTLLLLQPILTSIWGHLFLAQHLSFLQILGIVTALIGIRLANLAPVMQAKRD